jgi:lycopene cyclase domain-containing protein
MRHWQYLALLGGCVLVTLPPEAAGARAYRRPARWLRAVLPVAAVFLVWDGLAIAAGVWSYNPGYLTGVRLPGRMPLEELLFSLIMPTCGLLTYEAVDGIRTILRRRRERGRRGSQRRSTAPRRREPLP